MTLASTDNERCHTISVGGVILAHHGKSEIHPIKKQHIARKTNSRKQAHDLPQLQTTTSTSTVCKQSP
jgi:hypothetical protein